MFLFFDSIASVEILKIFLFTKSFVSTHFSQNDLIVNNFEQNAARIAALTLEIHLYCLVVGDNLPLTLPTPHYEVYLPLSRLVLIHSRINVAVKIEEKNYYAHGQKIW